MGLLVSLYQEVCAVLAQVADNMETVYYSP